MSESAPESHQLMLLAGALEELRRLRRNGYAGEAREAWRDFVAKVQALEPREFDRPSTRELLSLDFVPASMLRWEWARRHFGGVWVGRPPLEELPEELVDARNYAYVAHRRGDLERDDGRVLLDLIDSAGQSVWTLLRRVLRDARRPELREGAPR